MNLRWVTKSRIQQLSRKSWRIPWEILFMTNSTEKFCNLSLQNSLAYIFFNFPTDFFLFLMKNPNTKTYTSLQNIFYFKKIWKTKFFNRTMKKKTEFPIEFEQNSNINPIEYPSECVRIFFRCFIQDSWEIHGRGIANPWQSAIDFSLRALNNWIESSLHPLP